MTEPYPFAELAAGFTLEIPIGYVSDPDNDPYYVILECEDVSSGRKFALMDKEFSEMCGFISQDVKATLNA